MNEDLHRASLSTPSTRALLESSRQRVRQWTSNEVMKPLVEPILHRSVWRIRALGFSTMVGHPLFWAVWAL